MTGTIKTITVETTVITINEKLGESHTIYRFESIEELLKWYKTFKEQSVLEQHPNYNMY